MRTERDRSGIPVIAMVTSMLLCHGVLAAENYIIDRFSVYKSQESDNGFANTGLAYDTKRDLLLLGNCYNNSVEFYDKAGKRVRPALSLAHLGVRGLQGVAYDTSDDTLWIWAGAKQPDKKTRFMIWHCDTEGKQLEDPFEFSPTPGMISYDKTTDSLWAASYDWDDGYQLYRVSCKTKELVETLEPGEGIDYSEGVGYDPFDGTLWLLGRSYLFHVRKVGAKYELIRKYPTPSENCPEDRAALDKLGKLQLVGTDWAFTALADGRGTIAKGSGGLKAAPFRARRTIIVEGSGHNDGRYRVLEMNDGAITVEGQDGAKVQDEKPGREVTMSRFIGGADEGVAVDPTDHTIWINTDTDKGRNAIPGCNRCWHLDPLAARQ